MSVPKGRNYSPWEWFCRTVVEADRRAVDDYRRVRAMHDRFTAVLISRSE